eukprot:CAMPEP_0168570360 /NCGR_PEP_ID=MMETSP0413-20121227/16675_1 /TAXON_ID=136452 /ORGANISM="Filamoeba nolandi, Strain NC-AS-23-1" /LENGTH=257 /DNA_ID=CAMNT_0008602969 /DNA_START=203 /DNA_END=976 /DNA_ORIENTATION=-
MNRTLDYYLPADDSLTAESCVSSCQGYIFAGLFSNVCFCGDIINTFEYDNNTNCDLACPGNSSQSCGGSGAMNVYYISDKFPQYQWASSVANFSSEYDPAYLVWSADDILGASDVYPQYGDIEGAWTQELIGTGQEYIEVNFPVKVPLCNIAIYQTYCWRGITNISVRDESGDLVSVWSGDVAYNQTQDTASIFSPELKTIRFLTNSIRIELDTTDAPSWVELDAVLIESCDSVSDSASSATNVAFILVVALMVLVL